MQPAAEGLLREPVRFRGSIYYRDDEEMVRTLVAMSFFCREWCTRLHFIGSQADCDRARAGVAARDPDAAVAVRFTAALPEGGFSTGNRRKQNRALRAAMSEAIALDPGAVVWLELSFKPGSLPGPKAGTLRSRQAIIRNLSTADAPILFTAYQLDHLSDEAVRTLLASCDLVTSAPFAVSFCRDYLTTRLESTTAGVPEDVESLTPPGGINLLQLMRSENMVTLGRMAAGIAHELGNPLTIISSSLQHIYGKLGETDSMSSEFVGTALENVERMDVMLRNMLNFAAAKRNPTIDMDLNAAISEVLSFTAQEFRRRGVRVAVLPDSMLPPVRMDIFGFKEIVLNLVMNAFEAMCERGDTLTVRTRWSPDSSSAAVEVENNGPPIAEDVLSNLFRPFYTTKTEGTGLGLYLARQIAKDHGGDLRGQNVPDAVRFTLTLPVRGEEERDSPLSRY